MKSNFSLRGLLIELRTDTLSEKAIPALSVGFTTGLGLLVAQIAYATFIFSGSLAPYSSQGVGLVLFGNFATCLIIAVLGNYRGVISGLSPALILVMAAIGLTIETESDALFVTVVAALMIGAICAGLIFLIVGKFQFSNLVRFIPYPVAGGFVAGIGGAVCLASLSLMGVDTDWRSVLSLAEPAVFWRWSPGVVYGVILFIAMKRQSSPLILPVSVVIAVGAYHFALGALDITGDEARAAGLLLTSTSDGRLWPSLTPLDFLHVDWTALAAQIPTILTLVLVSIICVVMNIAGLEVAVNREFDWDREFKATGCASIVSGLGGGTAASIIVPASLRSELFGATTRLTGVVTALVIGSALLFDDKILEWVPVPLVGGILIFAGLSLLDIGLIKSRKRLAWLEYGIIVLIFFTIIVFGLLEGVGIGMVASLMFFALRLSRIDVIESKTTLREYRSNKFRPVPDRAILSQQGDRAVIYRLRGYIFFGSVYPLVSSLRQSLDKNTSPVCLMLDFSDVSGFDFSAVNVLSRLLQSANSTGVTAVLCSSSDELLNGLKRNLPPAEFNALQIESCWDKALEQCEELIILAWRDEESFGDDRRGSLLESVSADLEQYLEQQIHFEELMDELRDWLSPGHYSEGDVIAGPDAVPIGLQLLCKGRASAYDAKGVRISQFSSGEVIWPTISEDGRVVSVIADESCETQMVTPDTQHWLENHKAELAIRLYRYLLAGRSGIPPKADQ